MRGDWKPVSLAAMLVTVLMPCLNEERAIGRVIEEIPQNELERDGYTVEVLVVDGGSSDRSVEIAEDKGARVVPCERGYGRQYRRGFERARGEVIVTADSDGSYPVHLIPEMLRLLRTEDLEFISVNRFADLPLGTMPLVNILGNLAFTGIVNVLFGLNLRDSQSGMWIFRRDVLSKISLKSWGMSLSEEIKIEAFTKLRAEEVDGEYHVRIGRPKLRRLRDGAGNLVFLAQRWMKE